ncbi:MAG: hypothetical protein QOD02_2970 [Mycobacterium sp.]|jgi:hypothetical protein|nr:hypothetical protein [Mycobacterium sp.]
MGTHSQTGSAQAGDSVERGDGDHRAVLIGVMVLYAAPYVLALVAAFWFVVPQIWRDQVGHPASLRDYFELAWLASSLAMIGGALGAALEPDEAVRAAAYVQHSDEEAEVEQTN